MTQFGVQNCTVHLRLSSHGSRVSKKRLLKITESGVDDAVVGSVRAEVLRKRAKFQREGLGWPPQQAEVTAVSVALVEIGRPNAWLIEIEVVDIPRIPSRKATRTH